MSEANEQMRAEFMAWVRDRGCDTDGAWSAWQAASAGKADLLDALRGLLPVTFTGNPTRAEEVAHWTREHELGNGQAAAVLAAYAAISKVTWSTTGAEGNTK